MVHTLCVLYHLKNATYKMKTLTNMVSHQLGKMVIKMPAFETLKRQEDMRRSSFKPSLDCRVSSPLRKLAAVVFLPHGLSVLTQHTTSGHGRPPPITRSA
jgi:hypothetical protein